MKIHKIVVMGVSGCGKSLIGSKLAKILNFNFFDGDDYHSVGNITKMSNGIPLTDIDREDWLNTLSTLIYKQEKVILACSALTPKYREILSKQSPELQFIYLKGDFHTIWQRHQKRENHYFNGESLLKNQFNTLIEPNVNESLIINIKQSVDEIIDDIQMQLNSLSP